MDPKTESESLTTDSDSSSQSGQTGSNGGGSKRNFDTFETQFFQQGDAESAGVAGEVEHFDDLDDSHKRRRLAPSRQFMMGVGVGSVCIAIIGAIALWRGSTKSHSPSKAVMDQTTASVQVEPAPAHPVMAPSPPVQADPANPASAGASQNLAVAAAPEQADSAPALAQADPAAVAVPPPAGQDPSQATPSLAAPSGAASADAQIPAPPAPAQPMQVVEDKAQPAVGLPAKPVNAAIAGTVPAAPAPEAESPDVQSRCKQAMSDRHSKEILAACPQAFAADSSAAEIAVALAKVEFDRGRSARAVTWAKKAIAADPNAADAYVFIGGAAQNAGHRKAAKEAYKRYLQLAPGGRYAADLRAIVRSL